MPATARARLMAIAAAELPAQAAQHAAEGTGQAAKPPARVVPSPRGSVARPRSTAPRVRISDRFSLPAWTPLATGAVAAVIAVTGIGVAVSRSLPDDWLHGKSSTTTTQLNGADSNAAIDKLNQARTQMNALVSAAYRDAVAHHGTLSPAGAQAASTALHAWSTTSAAGTRPLLASARTGDATARSSLLRYTSDEVRSLSSALPNLPSPVKAEALRQISALEAINTALDAPLVPTS